jgi:hypothetical protein
MSAKDHTWIIAHEAQLQLGERREGGEGRWYVCQPSSNQLADTGSRQGRDGAADFIPVNVQVLELDKCCTQRKHASGRCYRNRDSMHNYAGYLPWYLCSQAASDATSSLQILASTVTTGNQARLACRRLVQAEASLILQWQGRS